MQARASSTLRESAKSTLWNPALTALWARKSVRFLVDFDHGPQIVQLCRPAKVLQGIEVERSILRLKLHVVEQVGVTDHLDHVGPNAMHMGP